MEDPWSCVIDKIDCNEKILKSKGFPGIHCCFSQSDLANHGIVSQLPYLTAQPSKIIQKTEYAVFAALQLAGSEEFMETSGRI